MKLLIKSCRVNSDKTFRNSNNSRKESGHMLIFVKSGLFVCSCLHQRVKASDLLAEAYQVNMQKDEEKIYIDEHFQSKKKKKKQLTSSSEARRCGRLHGLPPVVPVFRETVDNCGFRCCLLLFLFSVIQTHRHTMS